MTSTVTRNAQAVRAVATGCSWASSGRAKGVDALDVVAGVVRRKGSQILQ